MSTYRIKDWDKRERPREKLVQHGASYLTNSELLAIIIGSGTTKYNAIELSREILKKADNNLNCLKKFSLEDYMNFHGMGVGKSVKIIALFELFRRIEDQGNERDSIQIGSSAAAWKFISPLLTDLDHEECWIILLNRACRVIGKKRISTGGISATIIDIKLVIKSAMQTLASAIILVHNHPSGNPAPSTQDITQTHKVREAAKMCDIELIDHIIVAGNSYFSFSDSGKL